MDILTILCSKPHNSHYLHRYLKFIHSCSFTNDEYTENHHICPKSKDLFPEYEKSSWNIVKLTARQHFIAHHLLWKTYSNSSMAYVFKCFTDGQISKNIKRTKYKITNRIYEKLKIDSNKLNSEKLKNHVIALNLLTGDIQRVTKEEFDHNSNLVGAAYGNSRPKSIETKLKMSKPKTKEHAAKIKINVAEMRKDFICCLVTKKIYTQLSWPKHYKILYEPGYAEKLGKTYSSSLKGLTKTIEHSSNISSSKKLNNQQNRVSDVITRKEYDITSFKRWVLNKPNHQPDSGRI
jgi:hypothetical protein